MGGAAGCFDAANSYCHRCALRDDLPAAKRPCWNWRAPRPRGGGYGDDAALVAFYCPRKGERRPVEFCQRAGG
eukprot:4272350-Alexandrium_andersonii.AAC.1